MLEWLVRRIERHLRRCGLLGTFGDEVEPHALGYDKPLCASLDGFTLHAATRAGALHPAGRKALLRYALRPAVAQERVQRLPDGLVRITLKRAYADGTIAVDMDPLSLLCRLATSVPPPRRHTIRYSGVLAPASPWRRVLAPMAPSETPAEGQRLRRPEGAPSSAPGRSSWRAPSRWTSSPAPSATGG